MVWEWLNQPVDAWWTVVGAVVGTVTGLIVVWLWLRRQENRR